MDERIDGMIWDLASYFPAFDGPEMRSFKKQLQADVADAVAGASSAGALSEGSFEVWETLLLKAEDIMARLGHIFSYVGNLSAADAANEAYPLEEAGLIRIGAEFNKFNVKLQQALKSVPDAVFEAFIARPKLDGAQHQLRRTRERAQKTMSLEQEILASDLGVDGFQAWGQLYDKLTGKLEFEMRWPDGRVERTPIARWRSLMSDADREVGRAAFEGGNVVWLGLEDTCAAALNAIAGTRLTLNRHRGIDDFLYPALFQSSIKQETLDAMYKAIHAHIETAREILRTKARAMGRQGIAMFEREAPLPLDVAERYNWEQGVEMVSAAFDRAYPALGQYYKDFLGKRWMESESRGGKRPGAYCTGSEVTREQRVYMTFSGSLGDVSTMAHEMGHAWHGHLLKDMRPFAQGYPMTLAETASIFAEHILADGFSSHPAISPAQKLLMLDESLCGAAILLLDITVRFEFEKQFYTERKAGEVSVSRLKQLMVEAQQRVFGDSLEAGGEDPMFWASKLHFYIPGAVFYNFPYTFGFLLARTLYVLFEKQGAEFLPKYEQFLRLTGAANVEEVAQRSIGADTTSPEFWAAALQSLEQPLKQYKQLIAEVMPGAAKGGA